MINPIILGVTGHRALREQDIPALRSIISQELGRLITSFPHTPFVMLNSLASGADSLCAEIALSIGIKLICPLPMPAADYRRDFLGADAILLDKLLDQADRVFVTPGAEALPENATRDDHYLQAGIFVAKHCHMLLALWDGSIANPNGCGTAEIVEWMLNGGEAAEHTATQKRNSGAVLHIFAPQQKAGNVEFVPMTRILENEPGSIEITLTNIDRLNAQAGKEVNSMFDTEHATTDTVTDGTEKSEWETGFVFDL